MQAQARQLHGIPLDSRDILDAPSTILIGGDAGVGKTFAIASLLPPKRTLWICSDPSVLHAPAQLILANPELAKAAGLELPEFRVTVPASVPGKPDVRLSNKKAIHDLMCVLAEAQQAGKSSIRNIVFSNWDVFCSRIYDDIVEETKVRRGRGEKLGQLDHVIETKSYAMWCYDVCRANGFNGIFEVNERPPKFDQEEGSPERGKMLARRGPNMPIYTMIEAMVNDCKAYVRLIRDPFGKRKWQTTATSDTWAKLRGFSEPPFVVVPPSADGRARKTEDLSLPELLALAGYRF